MRVGSLVSNMCAEGYPEGGDVVNRKSREIRHARMSSRVRKLDERRTTLVTYPRMSSSCLNWAMSTLHSPCHP